MAFIFGVASGEADLYKVFRDFISGRGRAGQVTQTGTGNGKINNLLFPEGSTGLNETFTLTCESTGPRGGTFGVVGSRSGVLPDAVVGAVFKHPLIEFYLDFGTVDFQLGDEFVIEAATLPANRLGFTYFRGMQEMSTEELTLTCTTPGRQLIAGVQSFIPAVFSVTGSVTGALPNLTQAEPYATPVVRMLLAKEETSPNQYQLGEEIKVKTTRNPLRQISQHWEILRQVPITSPQFGQVPVDVDSQLVIKGPGLAQADEIFHGLTRNWSDASASAWWVHFGMAGYVPNMTMQEQPLVQGGQAGVRPIHTFWSLQIPYTIIASGRCFKLITRTNIYYSQSYGGFYLPSTMPKYNGYPAFTGGTGDTRSTLWSALDANRSSFWDYQGDASGGSAYALAENKQWNTQYGSNGGVVRWTDNRVDPWGGGMLSSLRNNLDGSVPAFQAQLTSNMGFLDGVYAVPGRDGRQPEEIMVMRDGKRMLVTQNHHRSGFGEFAAFTLE